ncbi:MAG TPA: hypothetical protein VM925_35210 [Labilithrix sp.]|nr:hypothetical protein [Labilithrix sp.]
MVPSYRHFLVPRSRSYRPSFDRVAALVERLRADRWLLTRDDPAFEQQLDYVLHGSHTQTGGFARLAMDNPTPGNVPKTADVAIPIPAPLTATWLHEHVDSESTDARFAEIALVFPLAIRDGGFAKHGLPYPFTFGEQESTYHAIEIHLARELVHRRLGDVEPIETMCHCGAELGWDPRADDPYPGDTLLAIESATRIDHVCPACGATFEPSGVTAYRFAIVIDCGKGWPREHAPIAVRPEFRKVCEEMTGTELDDTGEFS